MKNNPDLDPTKLRAYRDDKTIIDNWKNFPDRFTDSMIAYQNWFDGCRSIRHCIAKADIDFHNRVCTVNIYKCLGDPREKTALEIGYGGGRLILSSSRVFKHVIGIDVISEKSMSMTKKFLDSHGSQNYKLLNMEKMKKIADDSIDFIYSYIVFQHINSIEIFHEYMSLIKRVLKPSGVGNIFFGLLKDDANSVMHKIIKEDGFFHWHKDFEKGSRDSTLYYDPSWVKAQMETVYDMKIISMIRYPKQIWADKTNLSSQFCVQFTRQVK